jgi:RimJ/RimL family protein N-acetyltransferase
MSRTYKCLPQTEFTYKENKLLAIRDEDKDLIMKWRNEQINILRQKDLLTAEKQNEYFKNVVEKLFEQEAPNQLLFSFFENNKLIGYGGLVHIDWESRNAEISFMVATERNKNEEVFSGDFLAFLNIIFYIAFDYLQFIKLHTTFYDTVYRIFYKKVIEEFGFIKEGKLKDHILINGQIEDVCIYSFFNFK